MPIYMDRHDLEKVTAKDVAEAHREDLKIQHHYNCNGLTYWYDEERGTAFCLIEAPDADCVKRMHDDAHGLVPHQIIEVEPNVVSAFLGRIEDPKSSTTLEHTSQPIIEESAFRVLMYICLKDVFLLKKVLKEDMAIFLINSARDIIQSYIKRYSGREVKKDRKKVLISFTSAASAVMCALEIQNEIDKINKKQTGLKIKISLSAGSPVTDQESLFGETVQLAERLCEITNQKNIVISSEVKKVYNNEVIEGLPKNQALQALSPDDEKFVNRLVAITETIWNDPKIDVGVFGKQVGLSRSQFYRKVSSITGLSPNDFIREFRLNKALSLIENQKGNVAQIAFDTGFNSASYFSKCFQKRYGVLPSNLVSNIE